MKKVTILTAALVLGALGFVYYAAGPEQGGGHSSRTANLSELAQGANIVDVSLPDTLSNEAQIGKRIFEAKCATCHGESASGKNGSAPPLVHPIYEPNHHADMAFVIAAKNGVRAHHWPFGNMPPVDGLTDGDVKMIIQYIRALQQENGIY